MNTFDQHRNKEVGRSESVFIFLSGIFIASLVLTNVIAGKFFVLFGQELSSGIIVYPVTFLVTDIVSEIYGLKRAKLLVFAGFAVSVFVTIIIWLAGIAPIFEHSPVDEKSFNTVFGLLPGIIAGSMTAYLVAQYFDVKMFEFWRKLTNGKYLWLRNNGSTVFSQLIDTVLVVTIALVIWPKYDGMVETTAISMEVWWGIVIGQYLFKGMIALLDTPLIYISVHYLKRYLRIN